MVKYYEDVMAKIAKDINNPIVNMVIENVGYVYQQVTPNNVATALSALKTKLDEANKTLKIDKITEICNEIANKLVTEHSDASVIVTAMYSEYDLASDVKAIKESTAYSDPVIRPRIDRLIYEMSYGNTPGIMHMAKFMTEMSGFEMNESVKSAMNRISSYVEANRKKLILLESVYRMDCTMGQYYKNASASLKKAIVEGKFSSDILRMELGETIANMPMVKEALTALASIESVDKMQFESIKSDSFVDVYSYIGPAIKTDESVIVPIEGAFVEISEGKKMDPSRHSSGVVDIDNTSINIMKSEYMSENHADFIEFYSAFESLGFSRIKSGLKTTAIKPSMEIRVDESGHLDLYVAGSKISETSNVNINEAYMMESVEMRSSISKVMTSLKNLYHMEFLKNIINKASNRKASIIKIHESFVLYDNQNSNIDIYKMDGFKLAIFMRENFNYDISSVMGVYVSEAAAKIAKLEEVATAITNEIQELAESVTAIDETFSTSKLEESDIEKLVQLRTSIDNRIVALKEKYTEVINKKQSIITSKPILEAHKVGDEVTVEGTQYKIAAADPSNDKYLLVSLDGKMRPATSADLGNSAPEGPEVQSTDEAPAVVITIVPDPAVTPATGIVNEQPCMEDNQPLDRGQKVKVMTDVIGDNKDVTKFKGKFATYVPKIQKSPNGMTDQEVDDAFNSYTTENNEGNTTT
jgi:hypothetical protein